MNERSDDSHERGDTTNNVTTGESLAESNRQLNVTVMHLKQLVDHLNVTVMHLKQLVDHLNVTVMHLKQLVDNLKEVNKEVSAKYDKQKEFISIAAHELKSPIMPILGTLELIEYEFEEADKKEITLKKVL